MRRKTDKAASRIVQLLIALAFAWSILAVVVSYKAIVATTKLDKFISDAADAQAARHWKEF